MHRPLSGYKKQKLIITKKTAFYAVFVLLLYRLTMNKLRVTIALLLITICAPTAVAQFLNFNLSQDFKVKTYNTRLSHGDMTYEISVDFPVSGPRPLIDSIRTHVFDRLFAYDSFSGDDDASMTYKVPPLGTDLTPLLEKAGRKFIQDNLEFYSEMQESDPEYTISNSYQQKIKLHNELNRLNNYYYHPADRTEHKLNNLIFYTH